MDADFVVVGAGPAGLHAALKAAVLNHSVLVLDKGAKFSRVCQARSIANVPLAPGVSGERLLAEGRRDLARFESQAGKRLVALVEPAEAVRLARVPGGFEVEYETPEGRAVVRSRVVVLATGMVDRKPGISAFDEKGHRTLAPLVREGHVGYCLLCEGWRLEGKRVAVVGHGAEAVGIANDVRTQFLGFPTLVTDGHAPAMTPGPGVEVEERPIERFQTEGAALTVHLLGGATARFDVGLLSLGVHRVNSGLARMVGAATTPDGFVKTDGNCEVLGEDGARIEGLFAIGDLRADQWKQVVIAWGDAETAVLAAYALRLPSRGADAPPRGQEPRRMRA